MFTTTTSADDSDSDYYDSSIAGVESVRSSGGTPIEVDRVTEDTAMGNYPASFALNVTTAASDSASSGSFYINGYYLQSSFGGLTDLPTVDPLPAAATVLTDSISNPNPTLGDRSYVGVQVYSEQGLTAAEMLTPGTITGGSVKQILQETRTSSQDAAGNPTISLAFGDKANDVTSTISFAGTGATGSVTQTSEAAAVATFAIDVNGYGTIMYSDGSQGTIARFGILN